MEKPKKLPEQDLGPHPDPEISDLRRAEVEKIRLSIIADVLVFSCRSERAAQHRGGYFRERKASGP
jgi:hypothetical protein